MKTKFLLISIIAAVALSFSAQAQKFGDDIVIHECHGDFWAKPKISVADNGWIYVLMNKYGHPTEKDETRIFRSKDGGVTFGQIYYGVTPEDWRQGGRDLVVTGDIPSDITIWYVFADNNSTTEKTIIRLAKMDADGGNWTNVHSETYEDAETKDVAISTNARSPEDEWAPFVIGFAATTRTISVNRGNVNYSYSIDGGATFSKKWMYNKVGSEFGAIDLSIGQAKASAWYPFAGFVFEMDKGAGKGNIGFIASSANGDFSTDALKVNNKYSSEVRCIHPKIQWLCNNTLDEPYNFMIAYTDIYSNDDYDIIKIYPTAGYNLSNHTLDNLSCRYIAGSSDKKEDSPDLSYDKNYNNYLLAYRERVGNECKLVYKVQHYTKIDGGSDEWSYIGDISTTSTGYDWFYSPVVDIDLTRTQACFAFEYYNSSSEVTKLLADTEWSTVGVEERPNMSNSLDLAPNPTHDKTVVKVEETGEYQGMVYDLHGRKVMEFSFSGTEHSLNVTGLPAGVYTVHLQSDAANYVSKVIVE